VQNALPDVLAVAQVALEGAISAKAATTSLARGELPQGDLIPWTVAQQYQVSRTAAAHCGVPHRECSEVLLCTCRAF
jgi:tRNA(Met) C34 N-acetyltransferase TmcA